MPGLLTCATREETTCQRRSRLEFTSVAGEPAVSACGAWQQAADMYAAAGDWVAASRVAAAGGGNAARRLMWLRHAHQVQKTQGPAAAVKVLVEVRNTSVASINNGCLTAGTPRRICFVCFKLL